MRWNIAILKSRKCVLGFDPLHITIRFVTLLPSSLYFLFLSAHLAILFTHLLVGMASYSDTRFWFPDIDHTGYRLVQQCENVSSSTIISMILETSFRSRTVLAYIVFIPSPYSHFHYILPNHFPLVAFSKPGLQRMLPVFVGLTRLNILHALKFLCQSWKIKLKGESNKDTLVSAICVNYVVGTLYVPSRRSWDRAGNTGRAESHWLGSYW
jgi:hypothetical protein